MSPEQPIKLAHRFLVPADKSAAYASYRESVLAFWTEDRKASARPIEEFLGRQIKSAELAAPPTFSCNPVTDYSTPPASSTAKFYLTIDGVAFYGTAFIATLPNDATQTPYLATAGHCVFSPEDQEFYENFYCETQFNEGVYVDCITPTNPMISLGYAGSGSTPGQFDVAILTFPASELTSGATPLTFNTNYPGGLQIAWGYPLNPINGYPFNGQSMWYNAGYPVSSQNGCNGIASTMTPGCSGGPWVSSAASGSVVGVTSWGSPGSSMFASPLQSWFEAFTQAILMGPGYTLVDLYDSSDNEAVECVAVNGFAFPICYGYLYAYQPLVNEIGVNGLSGTRCSRGHITYSGNLEYLYVGNNGYVIQLDATTGNTIGQAYSLPGSGYHETAVLYSPSFVFAGCDGYVYCLQWNNVSNLIWSNGLDGLGGGVTRLAISADSSSLFVAFNHYVVEVDLAEATETYPPKYDLGSVSTVINLHVATSLFVGHDGMVLVFSSGVQSTPSTLSIAGSGEVRFDDDGTNLYCACGGWVTAYSIWDLTQVWQVSLPNVGSNVTSILCQEGLIIAGGNGYMHFLDATDGSVTWTSGLTGMALAEVNFAIDPQNPDVIYAGSNSMLAIINLDLVANPPT